jgi:hypothetical protein
MTYFAIISRHLPRGNWRRVRKPSGKSVSRLKFESRPSEYESEMVPIRLQRTVRKLRKDLGTFLLYRKLLTSSALHFGQGHGIRNASSHFDVAYLIPSRL